MQWKANRMLISNQRKIHSNVRADLVLVPMPRVHFNEKPLSFRRITLELNLGNSATLSTRNALRAPTAFHAPFRLHCAATLGLTTSGNCILCASLSISSTEEQTTVSGTVISLSFASLNSDNLSRRRSAAEFWG